MKCGIQIGLNNQENLLTHEIEYPRCRFCFEVNPDLVTECHQKSVVLFLFVCFLFSALPSTGSTLYCIWVQWLPGLHAFSVISYKEQRIFFPELLANVLRCSLIGQHRSHAHSWSSQQFNFGVGSRVSFPRTI